MRSRITGSISSRALFILFGVLLAGGLALALEEAVYTVLETKDGFELRRYAPQVVAETVVEGDFDAVGNEGFRRLFAYISGNNRKKDSIPMAAPVSQEPVAARIDMTAPVGQTSEGDAWRITFVMPSGYTIATAPEPLDARVTISEVPGRLVAALRYSGTWDRERYEEKEAEIRKLVRERGLTPAGEPVFARYNSPFSLWFLRRNEVLLPVEEGSP